GIASCHRPLRSEGGGSRPGGGGTRLRSDGSDGGGGRQDGAGDAPGVCPGLKGQRKKEGRRRWFRSGCGFFPPSPVRRGWIGSAGKRRYGLGKRWANGCSGMWKAAKRTGKCGRR